MTTASEERRGLLVAVANPEAVAPLVAIAISASDADDPPPIVLGLTRPEGKESAVTSSPGEAPPSAALIAASDYASKNKVAIQTRSIWSRDPAGDIIAAAQASRVSGILVGYHRTALGSDTMGGVVREVFTRATSLPLSVSVFIQGTDHPFERIYVAVDGSPDGRAALGLAVRVARRNKAKLRALVVSNSVPHDDTDLMDMVHEAQMGIGRLFHTDVLTERSLNRLLKQTPGRLLVVGRKFASEVGMPLDEVPGGDRCVLVVQGVQPV